MNELLGAAIGLFYALSGQRRAIVGVAILAIRYRGHILFPARYHFHSRHHLGKDRYPIRSLASERAMGRYPAFIHLWAILICDSVRGLVVSEFISW